MNSFPEIPPLDESGDFRGHLWIQELPTGGRVRFHVAESGLITFGISDETFAGVEAVPPPYWRAADAISAQIDRTALRNALAEPDQVTFFGRATQNTGVDYDWAELPPFVGIDVWSPRRDEVLPPDTATTIFRRLGLPTLPAVEKEARAAHTDFSRYETAAVFPSSVWREGNAAAVLIRDKTGGRARVQQPERGQLPDSVTGTPAELAAEHATDERIERTIDELTVQGQAPTADTICTRLVADVARERYVHLRGTTDHITATQEFQSTVAARVRDYLRK